MPLPSESPLGITAGLGAAGARSCPGSGRALEAVGRSFGCSDCAGLGAFAVPLQGSAWAGQLLGRSSAALLGSGFNPESAAWARAGPGVHLGEGVCVLGQLQMLLCVGSMLAQPKGPFLLEIRSHKAANHGLLWPKKLCVQANRLFSP